MDRPKKHVFFYVALTLSYLLLPVSSAFAEITQVTSREGLSSNDFVDWSSFGQPGTLVPSGSFAFSGIYGLMINVSILGNLPNDLKCLSQGNGGEGNFAPGDNLLSTNGGNAPVIIDFPVDIFGAGVQVQTNAPSPSPIVGFIFAYDKDGNLLQTFTNTGRSTNAADNSAPFVGITDSYMRIHRLVLSAASGSEQNDFLFNKLDFWVDPSVINTVMPPGAPLPRAVLLFGSGLGVMVGLHFCRWQKFF